MTDTLKLDPTKSHTLEFAVDITGEDGPAEARLAMEVDGVIHMFPGKVEDGKAKIIIPRLSRLVNQDVVQTKLEILVGSGDGHRFFVPSRFEVALDRGTKVTAGMPTLLQESIEEAPETPEEVVEKVSHETEDETPSETLLPVVTVNEPSGPELTLESLGVNMDEIELDDEPLLEPTKDEIAERGKKLRNLARARKRFSR